MDDSKDRLLFDLEQFLIGNGASDYLHYFLRFNYDRIRNGEVILILAPIDDALQRLATRSRKSLDEISNSVEGKDILTNFLASRRVQSEISVYVAINGANLKTIGNLTGTGLFPNAQLENLTIRIVDGIINMPGQLERLQKVKSQNVPSRGRNGIIGGDFVVGFSDLPNPIIRKIVLEMSLSDIVNSCRINALFNSGICDNDNFWNEKARKDYPTYRDGVRGTWKETYTYLVGLITYYGIYLNYDMYESGIMDYSAGPNRDIIVKGRAIQLTKPTKFYRSVSTDSRGIVAPYKFPFKHPSEERLMSLPDKISDLKYDDIVENGETYQFAPFFVHGLPVTVGSKVWAAYSDTIRDYYFYVGTTKESLAEFMVANYDRLAEELSMMFENSGIYIDTFVYDPNNADHNAALSTYWSKKDGFDEQVQLIPFTKQAVYNFVLNHNYFNLRDTMHEDDEAWLFFQIEF